MGYGVILKPYCRGDIMGKQNYSKEIFIHSIEILVKYNWEPEVEIFFINKKKIMIIAYKDFVDYINENRECVKFQNIRVALSVIKWEEIEIINSLDGIDFLIPIEKQSVVYNGELWLTKT